MSFSVGGECTDKKGTRGRSNENEGQEVGPVKKGGRLKMAQKKGMKRCSSVPDKGWTGEDWKKTARTSTWLKRNIRGDNARGRAPKKKRRVRKTLSNSKQFLAAPSGKETQ